MTLIAAWATKEFVLVGSDTQFGMGISGTRFTGKKLHQIPGLPIVWGLAGNEDLCENIGEWVDTEVSKLVAGSRTAADIGDEIGAYVAQVNKRMLDRAAAVRGKRQIHDGVSLVIGGRFGEACSAIIVDPFGSSCPYPNRSEGEHGVPSAGSGERFFASAREALRHYERHIRTPMQATSYLVRLMQDTIAMAEKYVGLPIHLWQVTGCECRQLSEEELAIVGHGVTEWKRSEAKTLPS